MDSTCSLGLVRFRGLGHKAQDIPRTRPSRETRGRWVEDFGFVMDVVIVTSGLTQLVLSTAALSE